MRNDFFLKSGQIVGLLFVLAVIVVFIQFISAAFTADDEVIGYGMLLPTFMVKLTPLLVGFGITASLTTLVIFFQRRKKQPTFVSEGPWYMIYVMNAIITFVIVGYAGLLLLLALSTFIF